MKGRKRILALGLTLAMVLSLLCVPGMAAGTEEESIPEGNQAEGTWVYEVVQAAMGGPGGGPGGPPPGGMGGDPGAGGGGGHRQEKEEINRFHKRQGTCRFALRQVPFYARLWWDHPTSKPVFSPARARTAFSRLMRTMSSLAWSV